MHFLMATCPSLDVNVLGYLGLIGYALAGGGGGLLTAAPSQGYQLCLFVA